MIGIFVALLVAAYFFWLARKYQMSGWKFGLLGFFAYVVPSTVIFHYGLSLFVAYYQIIESEETAFRALAGMLTLAVILYLLSEIRKRIVNKKGYE